MVYSLFPLGRRMAEPQSRSGRCGEGKNLVLPGIEPGSVAKGLRLYLKFRYL
jgi:hypothetical protein